MIIPGSKKPIGVIISSMHKDGNMSDGITPIKNEEEIDANKEALKSHAADMIEAIHSKSAHDLMKALYSFLEEWQMHEEGESEEEEKAEHDFLSK